MKKLSILFLLSSFQTGGAETQYGNLIRNINRNRFTPILGLIHYKNNVPSKEFLDRFGDVELHHFVRKCKFDFSVILSIALFAKKNNIDLIQSLLFMDNQLARFAGLISRIAVVTSIRGEIGVLLGPLKNWFEYRAQILSKRIVVNSAWLKNYLVEHGSKSNKVIVIHNGIDCTRQICLLESNLIKSKLDIPEDAPIVTIVARLHPMKDHYTFFDAIKYIKRYYPNICVLVVGDGAERDRLIKYVRKNTLSNNVRFLGDIGSMLPEIYRISNALMLTSQYGESFPNVLLEAMSASVPVIASNISGIPEIIEDGRNGYIVKKKDASQFADALLRILSDQKNTDGLVKEGCKTVKKFSIPIMIKNYELLYSELTGR